jgi:hypothetical protein
MRRTIALIAVLLPLTAGMARAQTYPGRASTGVGSTFVGGFDATGKAERPLAVNGTGILQTQSAVNNPPALAACKHVYVTPVNSGADITIDNTAGGIPVTTSNANRCALTIVNTGGANIRCCGHADCAAGPDSTHGAPIDTAGSFSMGAEGQDAWSCIRTGGSSSSVAIMESLP